MTTPTVLSQLGGPAAVRLAVDDFYRRVIGDPALASYFDDVDLRLQRRHMASFLVSALGGPNDQSRRWPDPAAQLERAHTRLHINGELFDRTARHLTDTLVSLNVDRAVVAEVIGRVATLRPVIVAA